MSKRDIGLEILEWIKEVKAYKAGNVSLRTRQLKQPSSVKRTKSSIPQFKSIEEAAAFWDTHDSTEFEDEFEDVSDVQFVVTRAEPKKGITIRLEEDVLETLKQEAQAKGIGPSTLIRMWILEHIRQPGKTP